MAALSGFSRCIGIIANNCLKRVGSGMIAEQRLVQPRTVIKSPVASYYNNVKWIPSVPEYQTEVKDTMILDDELTQGVIGEINEKIRTDQVGRLFAVVHICGKQFKVTENDIVIIQGYWPPNPGDALKLEKVLLVGGTDFTLVGRPMLNRELVNVDATVIEKTFSHTKTRFRMRPRKQYRRIHFYRIPHTMVRINSININGNINEKKDVEGLDRIY